MKFCTNCGAQLSDTSKFCIECGQKVEVSSPVAPAVEETVLPVQQSMNEETVQPDYETPVQPTYEAPVQPAYEAPAQDSYSQPDHSAAPVQPSYTPPAQYSAGNYTSPEDPAKALKEKKPIDKKVILFAVIGVVAVIALIALIFAICSGGNGDDAYLGLYEGTSCVVSGEDLGAEGEWIELKANGKATLCLMEDEFSVKWSLDGENLTVKQGKDTYTGTLKDGVITIDFEGMLYTFVNEKNNKPATVKPNKTAGEVGTWTLTEVISDDESSAVSAEDIDMLSEMGVHSYLELIEDGTGSFSLFGEELVSFTWEKGTLEFEDDTTAEYTVENGELRFTMEDMTFVFVPGEKIDSDVTLDDIFDETDPSDDKTEPNDDEDETEPDDDEDDQQSGGITGTSADWGDYAIEIVGAEKILDGDDKTAIRIYYDFTNNSDEITAPCDVVDHLVTQDGYEAKSVYAGYDYMLDDIYDEYSSLYPGATRRCVTEFSMKEDGGTVVYTIFNFWDEEQSLTAEFDPANLPGAPAKDLEFKAINEPVLTVDLPDEGEYEDDTYMVFDTAEITTGYDGEDILRVYIDFTNNSTEEQNFWWVANMEAFQDGVELSIGYPEDSVPEEDNAYTDVPTGETIRVAVCYELRNDHVVEVFAHSLWGNLTLGASYEVE